MNFYQKLVAIQSTLRAGKDKKNEFGGFAYRTAEGILAAVKPHLAEHGLFMSISDEIVQIGGDNITRTVNNSSTPNKEGLVTTKESITEVTDARFYLKATVTITDGENSVSASAMARETLSKKGMDDAQATGAASSYARKYALNGMFGIDDSKQDPDNGANNPKILEAKDAVQKAETKEEAIAALKAMNITDAKVRDAAMKELARKFK